MLRELFIAMSNQITSSLVALNLPVTQYTLLISVWPNVTWIVKASIFHTRMERIWLELQGMRQLPLIRAKNNPDVMIWSASGMCCSTCSRDRFHGKVSQAGARTKSMQPSRKRKLTRHWRTCAAANPQNSRSSWNTAGHWSLNKSQTTRHVFHSSRTAWSVTASILPSLITPGSRTGWQRTKKPWKIVWWTSFTRSLKSRQMRLKNQR